MRGMMRSVLALVLFSSGCAPENPQRVGDCARVLDPNRKQDCLVQVAIVTFKADPQAGEAFLETELTDPLQRDAVYFKVGATVYPNDGSYCQKIKEESFKTKCVMRQARPHLQGDTPRGRPPAGAPPSRPASGP